jgi:hypothetical protein
MKPIMCEECDIEMHEWSFEGESGYACQECGWSIDNYHKVEDKKVTAITYEAEMEA